MATQNQPVEIASKRVERNYGIDALRIFAMLMIVVWHMLMHGGITKSVVPFSAQYQVARFLEIMTACAVNCYALVSGYVGIKSNYRYSNMISIWLRTLFYSIGIMLICLLIIPEGISLRSAGQAVFPVIFGEYWYVTSYLGLFILMPILDIALRKLDRRQLRAILAVAIAVFSAGSVVARVVTKKDVFCLNNGCSMLWLTILYLIGGYVCKYNILGKVKTSRLSIVCVAIWLVSLLIRNVCELVGLHGEFVYVNTSPSVLAAAVCILVIFARLNFGAKSKKIIAWFAPLSFGVYLIHDNNFVRHFLMLDTFVGYATFSPILMLVAILGSAILIYVVCSVIDYGREWIFKKLKVKEHLRNCEEKILGDLWSAK